MPLLELTDVDAAYGDVQVLHDLSLTVEEGSIVGLLGRNGAGKSTVYKTIAGVLEPTAGSITYKGEEIAGLPPHAISRRGISLVPAERRIFPNLTVAENLRMAKEGQNGTDEEIERALEMFPDLREVSENRGQDLSGGQQQMIAIARGLIGDTDLLLLDEPIEGLAPQYVEKIVDSIGDIRDMGTTVMLIDHSVRLVLENIDEAYILQDGQVAYHDDAQAIRDDERIIEEYFGLSNIS
jgi:branched-chain amino acid transport system ATP-binding protein